jgi:myo-inositol-1(or 4)-monophosphatase
MLNIAVRAARRAGEIIVRHVDHVQRLKVDTKSYNDFVTEVDRLAEAAIIEIIHKAYPSHGILAEESGRHGDDSYQWVIDPLDGTTNFLHGYPQFAVSIALKRHGQIEQAVVFDPMRQELFTASRGGGALLNDKRMRVSKQPGLEGALLGTGFPVRQRERLDFYLETFKALFTMTSGIRRAGAAALDLAYIAAGRLDGFWELGLKEWDMAAGALLIIEAGGMVSDFEGGEDYLRSGMILGGNPKVSKEMIKILAPFAVEAVKEKSPAP